MHYYYETVPVVNHESEESVRELEEVLQLKLNEHNEQTRSTTTKVNEAGLLIVT